MQKQEHFVIWSMGLYFSWILSYPYFGHALKSIALGIEINFGILTLAFLLFHASGMFVGALVLKDTARWKQLMFGSLIAVIIINISMWFLPVTMWVPTMALAGFVSSFYILGWSCILATYSSAKKISLYLNFIVRANLITVLFVYLSNSFSHPVLLIVKNIPLLLALAVLIFLSPEKKAAVTTTEETCKPPSSIFTLMLILTTLLLYITIGLMYVVIQNSYPVMTNNQFALNYYIYIPYIPVSYTHLTLPTKRIV